MDLCRLLLATVRVTGCLLDWYSGFHAMVLLTINTAASSALLALYASRSSMLMELSDGPPLPDRFLKKIVLASGEGVSPMGWDLIRVNPG